MLKMMVKDTMALLDLTGSSLGLPIYGMKAFSYYRRNIAAFMQALSQNVA